MFEPIKENLHHQMEKAISVLKEEYSKIRTGRATPALLDAVRVNCYGSAMPLNQLATVTVPDARMLVIQPWDQGTLPEIEKAIQKSELGLTPQNDGKIIRLPIPPLTEERRKEYVKVVQKLAEDCRVSVRNIRRNGMDDLKKFEKEKKVSEDEVKRGQLQIQEVTDSFIGKIDSLAEQKSKELMAV